jgi:hypothetical protein
MPHLFSMPDPRREAAGGLSPRPEPCYHKTRIHPSSGTLKRFEQKRLAVADTKKIADKLERKKVKRAARKKAAPKGKRTTPRGSQKRKVKKMTRGQSKR